jgi:hypothetical protein
MNTNQRRFLRWTSSAAILALGVAAIVATTAPGQEPSSDETKQAEAAWRKLYRLEAETLELFAIGAGGKKRHKLSFNAEPVMRWVSFGGFNGDVFVWLQNDRPEVVGNIVGFPAAGLKENQRYTLAELHSLSDAPIVATPTADGQKWRTKEGLNPRAVSGAAKPAETARQRKLQTRELARSFSARMTHYGEKWKLRLLDKPLVEYGEISDDVLGGALFAFVAFRTDPELLLLLEARQGKEGAHWCFVPVRFSQQDLWLERDDKVVWESLVGPGGDFKPKDSASAYRVYDNKLQTLE